MPWLLQALADRRPAQPCGCDHYKVPRSYSGTRRDLGGDKSSLLGVPLNSNSVRYIPVLRPKAQDDSLRKKGLRMTAFASGAQDGMRQPARAKESPRRSWHDRVRGV